MRNKSVRYGIAQFERTDGARGDYASCPIVQDLPIRLYFLLFFPYSSHHRKQSSLLNASVSEQIFETRGIGMSMGQQRTLAHSVLVAIVCLLCSHSTLLAILLRAFRKPFKHVIIDPNPPREPHCKSIGDFDGDGFIDVVTASSHQLHRRHLLVPLSQLEQAQHPHRFIYHRHASWRCRWRW